MVPGSELLESMAAAVDKAKRLGYPVYGCTTINLFSDLLTIKVADRDI